jgi:flagella basal body P-ring formation protein FlgA
MRGLPALAGICLAAASVQAALCHITLPDRIEVAGPTLVLSDIAAVDCPGLQALGEAALGDAAHFGMTRLIDVDRIRSQYLRTWDGLFVLTAPKPHVQVTTVCDTLPNADLQSRLETLLAGEPMGNRIERHATILRAPKVITLPRGEREVGLHFVGLKRSGKVPLELRIGREGKVLRKIPVTADIRLKAPVAVVKTLVKRGEILTATHLAEEVREVTLASPGALPTLEQCLGKQAAMTLAPGRVVTLHLIDIPPLVRKGENAALIWQQGAVQVSVDAVVRRNGHGGEIIPVYNPANRKMVRALVQGNGTLRLLPEGG